MKAIKIFIFLLVLAGFGLYVCAYIVDERSQVFITQFGKPVGEPVTDAGIHFKLPFIQKINRFDKRILEWDGNPNQVPTKDKKFIDIDTFARWRISDPLLFFKQVRDELSAQSKLDDFLDGSTRSVIAGNELVEIVRSQQRELQQNEALLSEGSDPEVLPEFSYGRNKIVEDILNNAKPKLLKLGIELVDIRFKRINYSTTVQQEIFNRMIAERQRIADKFISEGEGEAAKIEGQRQRELKSIESEAYRKAEEIKGKADAEAIAIYASAFNQSGESREFYRFLKTLESYESSLSDKDQLILSTEADFYEFLHQSSPEKK